MKTKLALFFAVLAVALFGMGCASTETSSDPFKSGLVAYYPFNGNAKDESGNGKHGAVVGVSLTHDRHGNTKSAYDFNGSHAIKLPLSPKDTPEQNTLSGWIKIPDFSKHPTRGGDKVIFLIKFNLGIWKFSNETRNDIYGAYLLMDSEMKSPGPYPDPKVDFDTTKWCHLVGTYDGDIMMLYINGVPSGIHKPNRQVRPLTDPQIGNSHTERRPVYAQIDDVRIYNRALSAKEVKALYDLEKPKSK